MKQLYTISLFIILPFFSINAQHIFQKTYGGTDFEYGYVMRLTNDGGSIIGGVSRSPFTGTGGNDCYLVKLDSLGHVQWAKSYGTNVIDVVNDLWCTTDGGYIFGGYSSKSGGGAYTDGDYVIKVNSTGDTAWTRIFNFRNSGGDCYELTQANDGNYIIGNYTPTKGSAGFLAGLIKLNKNGDTLWTRIYDGSGDDWFYGIAKSYDGGFVLSGYTKTPGSGGQDFLLLKTDSNGNKQWLKAYGGSGDDDAYGHSVKVTVDSGYILCGETTSFGAGNTDMYLVKTDKTGNLQWSKTYGGTGLDVGHAVEQTSDGGYIIIGWTKSFGGGVLTNNENVYVVKTNSKGDTLWTRAYGGAGIGSGGGGDLAYDVKELKDAYLICGRTYSFATNADIYFIRIDKNGNSGCHQYYTKTIVKTPATLVTSPVLAQSSGCAIIHQVTSVHSGGTEKILCDSTIISCHSLLHVGFTMSDTARCFNGNTFTFTSTSSTSSGSIKLNWIISDTTSDTNVVITHHFRNTGIFNIKLVVLSDKGCSDSISLHVTVKPEPLVYLGKDTAIKLNGSVLLDAGPDMDSYRWNDGKTTRTNLIDSSGMKNNKKIVWVAVTKYSCVSYDTIIISFKTPNMIGWAFQNYFNIYPNPAKGMIYIKIKIPVKTDINGILTSFTGQIYETFKWKKVSDETRSLEISHLPAGVYLLKLLTADEIKIFRVIVY